MSGVDLRDAARRLGTDGRGFEPLKPTIAKGARPGEVATGRPSSAAIGQEEDGDLIEESYLAREYWDPVTITSSDGIFTIEVEPIKTVTLEDGRTIELKQPT